MTLIRKTFGIAVALAIFALAGCDSTIKTSDYDIKQITYPELRELLANPKKKGKTVMVDPRSEVRYRKAHVEGAVNIPIQTIVAGHERLADATSIVVVAGGWTDPLSPAATKKLMALGYKNVSDFRGGMELWKSEGGRVIEEPATSQPAAAK